MDKPFFRADQVGSLLRPAALLTAREQHAQGRLDAAGLRRVEDAAIQQVVRLQEECGFEVAVDGEFRRENWWIDFVRGLEGLAIQDGVARQTFVAPGSTEAQLQDKPKSSDANCGHDHDHDHDWTYVPKNVVTTGKLGAHHPVTVADFTSLQSVSSSLAKITLPSPTRLHFHGGRDSVSAAAYPDIEDFFDDVVKLYRAEIAALEAAGCRYIQIDDPLMSYFISDRMRAEVKASGDDPDLRLGRYVRLLNDCVAERSASTAVGVHVCRGNSRSGWMTEGGYQRIAEAVLGGLKVDHLLLEYDDARSGDFSPLRDVPKGVKVVLGLVTTKFGALEDVDMLCRRVDEAAKIMPLEDLAISPQCGFASTVEGNIITENDQWAKLRRVVEVARRVWG